MPTIKENKCWDSNYNWSKDGDEWDDQAIFCGKPYGEWKKSIADNFILKNINSNSVVLEIAPGHGRWTEFLLKSEKVILADLNPKCIEYCKNKFKSSSNISYFSNDGKSLSFVPDNSVDFIWSYDSFVHMEKDVIESYFKEFSRILKKGGKAIIHHAGRNDFFLSFSCLRQFGGVAGGHIYKKLTLGISKKYDGWRADVSKKMIIKIAEKYGLKIGYQINSWGKNNEFNVKFFNDYITELNKAP